MNTISLKNLKSIINVLKTNNIEDDNAFDYFRIVGLNNVKYEEMSENPLYFMSYINEEELSEGWYPSLFDLRKYANDIIKKNPNFTYVIEDGMDKDLENKNAKYIVVDSIPNAIDKLFEHFKSESAAKVISVTGSVGKTTTVGLIEKVLKEDFNVLRIYSKRITPIILKSYIINFLNKDIDFVVLENSIYYHGHVRKLCELLTPDIACMININSSHLNVEKLKTIDDICRYKSEILKNAKLGIINGQDEYLKELKLENNKITYKNEILFNTSLTNLVYIDVNSIKIEDGYFIFDDDIKVKPFIFSRLALIQYAIAYYIGKFFNIPDYRLNDSLNNYEPVENRLSKKIAFGKEIMFDGDITTYERIQELSKLNYDKIYLVIRKVGSAENVDRIANIVDHFPAFIKVYLFDDIEYLDDLSNCDNVEIVNNHDFLKNLDGTIIYHYSGYYRVWDKFDENNLNIYDNEKYKVLSRRS